ncbi:MAG: Unknown protein, partial [uncultured Thiotrichaceae bacterium]
MQTHSSTAIHRYREFTQLIRAVIYAVLLSLSLLWPYASQAQDTATGDHVNIRWLAPDTFVKGQTEIIGFYFEVDPEWHVYWR